MNSASSANISASLDDPFYYLTNFQFVLAWVGERHADLLAEEELAFLRRFAALPRASQALLARMVMRKGELFRISKLSYTEIGDSAAAIAPLAELGWVDNDPELDIQALFNQLRLGELRQALCAEIRAAGLAVSSAKTLLAATLIPQLTAAKPLCQWWPEASDRIVRLNIMAICDRFRLMFFGNLRQDWSEFVLTELGLQQFENVPFSASSRAFQTRGEVDAYLGLHRLRQRLEEGEPPERLSVEVPPMPDNTWLAARRSRLLYQLAHVAERGDDLALALALYAAADSGEARIRQLRVLERQGEHERALSLALQARKGAPNDTEIQALERLVPRLQKRLGTTLEARAGEPAFERWEIELPGPQPVEHAVATHFATPEVPVYYVENTLITGLFGLLCWPAIFAPLPGAFFHPFHHGPADLYRADFVTRRQAHFDECLAQLNDETYRQSIQTTWQEKQGLASPFVHWPLLDASLVELALHCLPAEHLRACFERLLHDPKANRAGLPDLIQFFPGAAAGEPRYRMIEVKGPGDRLQDNQRRWLAFFHQHKMPVAVCHVRWLACDRANEGLDV